MDWETVGGWIPTIILGITAVWFWYTAREASKQKRLEEGITYNQKRVDSTQMYNESTQTKALEVVLGNNDKLIANLITLNNGHFIKLTEEVANARAEHARQLQELVAAFNRFLVLEAQQASRYSYGVPRSLGDVDELMETTIKTDPVKKVDEIVATAAKAEPANEQPG